MFPFDGNPLIKPKDKTMCNITPSTFNKSRNNNVYELSSYVCGCLHVVRSTLILSISVCIMIYVTNKVKFIQKFHQLHSYFWLFDLK